MKEINMGSIDAFIIGLWMALLLVEDLLESIVEKGPILGARFCEARYFEERINSINVENGVAKALSSGILRGIGVRVFKNRGLGVAYTQSLDEKDIEEIVKKAVKYARAAQPDPYFKGIPGPSKAQIVLGLCDKEIVDLSLEDARESLRGMIEACEDTRRGGMYRGEFHASYTMLRLMASTEVNIEGEKTIA